MFLTLLSYYNSKGITHIQYGNMKSSQVRAGLQTFAPSKQTSNKKGKVNRLKEKSRNIGGLGTVLRKRHNKVRQDRKNALKNNWQFVYRIATAAMIIGKLKKSTEESNKLVHDSGIADYESFLNTINLPIEQRTESHIYKIARMVRPLKFFKDLNMTLQLIRELSRTAVVNTLKEGSNIILDGPLTSNKYIYILLVGSVEVYVRNPENIKFSISYGYKKQGDSFGTSRNPSKEEAFVKALENCEILVLEAKILQELLHSDRVVKAKKVTQFLRQVRAFKKINDYEIEGLSFSVSTITYRPGQILYKEGDTIDRGRFFMVVKRGDVEVYKNVPNKENQSKKTKKKLHFIKICHPHDIITCRNKIPQNILNGENYKFKEIRNLKNDVTAIAKTMCECLVLPQMAIYKRLSIKSMNYLAKYMPLYPKDIEATNQITKRKVWENYKKQLVNDILMQSKRNGKQYIKHKSLVTKKANRIFRSSQDVFTVKAAKAERNLKKY